MAVDKPLSTIDDPKLPMLQRKDAYWIEPMLTFIGLAAFGVYATWRAFENANYEWGPYLSPFYSPLLPVHSISPAVFILPFPLIFRATCYYYRKAYYRAFFADPSACAVKEPLKRPNYTGERAFPFVLQNIHRYTLYFAIIVLAILWWDAIIAFTTTGMPGQTMGFHVGIGSFIFLTNVILLSLFTFSCNSFRHLSGGCLNCFSCSAGAKSRHSLWEKVSHFNENHSRWAWLSLFSVAIVDLYVRWLAASHMPVGGIW